MKKQIRLTANSWTKSLDVKLANMNESELLPPNAVKK